MVATVAALACLAIALVPQAARAWDDNVIGVKIRIGARFDNVRMCVATPAGVRGGPAADISFFWENTDSSGQAIELDVPVLRPILFAASFHMLQFEPTVTYSTRQGDIDKNAFIVGPTLGLSLHYGPDYKSESKGANRGPSFFAMGPILGVYLGADFARPGETFNYRLGATPYLTPLFGIGDPAGHRGAAIGALVDNHLRFTL